MPPMTCGAREKKLRMKRAESDRRCGSAINLGALQKSKRLVLVVKDDACQVRKRHLREAAGKQVLHAARGNRL